jgi:hypothetical protein
MEPDLSIHASTNPAALKKALAHAVACASDTPRPAHPARTSASAAARSATTIYRTA